MTDIASDIDASHLREVIGNEYLIGAIAKAQLFSAGDVGNPRGTVIDSSRLNFRDVGGTIFLIDSEAGKFAYKVFSPSQPPRQCLLEASLIGWLKDNGFALVPNVVRTKSGALLGEVGNRKGLMLEYIPCSRELNWTSAARLQAECSEAGTVLAELQNKLAALPRQTIRDWGLSEKLPPASVGNAGQVGVSSIRPHLSDWLLTAFRLIRENKHSMDPLLKDATLKQEALVLAIVASAESLISQFDSDKTLFVHGDFHTGNLIWRHERVLAVIDFENAHFEHPLYDLAYATVMFVANWQEEDDKPTFNIDLGRELSRHYLQHSQVVNAEELRQLLPAYIKLTGVLILLWVMHDCMRSNRFEAQLKFLLAHSASLNDLGKTIVS